jgi:radical SAM superfamily enzyme YgiQ (UPF0313 family)
MSKILLLNPNRLGYGFTPIWVASHTGTLKKECHQVKLFDATFYKDWSENVLEANTKTQMYKPSDYNIPMKNDNVYEALQKMVDEFQPDVIFWGAISSHIHAEGEYANFQYGYELINNINTNALIIASGLQVTANMALIMKMYNKVNYFIPGESEIVLVNFLKSFDKYTKGIFFIENGFIHGNYQPLIKNLNNLVYDYSIFDDDIFYRPYNGKVYKAIDYEMSRGCPYTCDYCVESVIQKYYGFTERNEKGILKNSRQYLRNKTSGQIIKELVEVYKKFNITYIRCQDTNFLTIPRKVLNEVAILLKLLQLPLFFYIEVRPEYITPTTVKLLKNLHVDGIGMGIETASEKFRENNLHRFVKQEKIINAFKLLKEAGIKRTTYNVLGFCGETEEDIIETIKFNQLLNPDNISTSFYSPYLGTIEQIKAVQEGYFNEYEYNIDSDIRSLTQSTILTKEKLEYYRQNFTNLVQNE